ncbi:hypothetical protein AVEN_243418-1 [Araneus ventricosus]|uniref:Uncharacterized protein n=1 Tax=Araneus ventricosus TaxID=182803 RepID=A0A4Y2NZH4_ARAVE|nr:hypothetical protein AVEN_243418-1 [Araneus ventricosus]
MSDELTKECSAEPLDNRGLLTAAKCNHNRTFCGSATHQMAPPIYYWSTDALNGDCAKGLSSTKNGKKEEVRTDNNRTWRTPPIHDWYQQKHPGAVLELKGDRKLQTTITRCISGHTRTLSYVQGKKVFTMCLKCNTHQSTSDHLLSRVELKKRNLFESPALVRDFQRASGLLDLV